MNDRVLITGGLGYVGGRVARALSGNAGLALRLGTRRAAVMPPQWAGGCETTRVDVTSDDASIDRACEGVRYLVHLAAMNEVDSLKDPEGALTVNGGGTLRLLRAAERAGVERFIYLSTAHVYGTPLAGTITEKTVARPVHPYAITHRVAEDFVLASHDAGRLTGVVLRLSNGFGAPADADVNRWTLLVNDLCRQAASTGRLVLRSSGLQQRDFITLEDVARGIAYFLTLPRHECGDGLFNLGGETTMSVLAMAELVGSRCKDVLGFAVPVERPVSSPEEMAGAGALDYRIDRLKAAGFTLKGGFEAEIDATLRLCKQVFGQTRK